MLHYVNLITFFDFSSFVSPLQLVTFSCFFSSEKSLLAFYKEENRVQVTLDHAYFTEMRSPIRRNRNPLINQITLPVSVRCKSQRTQLPSLVRSLSYIFALANESLMVWYANEHKL